MKYRRHDMAFLKKKKKLPLWRNKKTEKFCEIKWEHFYRKFFTISQASRRTKRNKNATKLEIVLGLFFTSMIMGTFFNIEKYDSLVFCKKEVMKNIFFFRISCFRLVVTKIRSRTIVTRIKFHFLAEPKKKSDSTHRFIADEISVHSKLQFFFLLNIVEIFILFDLRQDHIFSGTNF